MNGKNIQGSQFSSELPTNSKQLNRITKILFHYLLALLLNIFEPKKNRIQIGNLSVQATCDNSTFVVLDVHGVLPVNKQEVTDMLEQNNVSKKLAYIVINYLLSQHSEEQS